MELIELLTNQLGVQEDQAKGGAGLLFKLAKEKLGDGDFSQIAEYVPGISQLISGAPQSDVLGGAVGGMLSKLGGGASQLGSLASLAGGFSKMGLDSSMIGKFIPLVLSFVQGKGGDSVKGLLEKVLK